MNRKNPKFEAITFSDFIAPIRLIGDSRLVIHKASSLDIASVGDMSFCIYEGRKAFNLLNETKASLIFCYDHIPDLDLIKNKCFLTFKNPKLNFIRSYNNFFTNDVSWGIDKTASINPNVDLVGRVKIGHFVLIDNDVKIGHNTIIESHVSIHSETTIGNNVHIQSGSIIGSEGQGMVRNENGCFEYFPQRGKVIISDGVHIGVNTVIVRGTFNNTKIGKGTMIGNLANIGHNVHIGENVFISAGVIIAGSTSIDDNSWLAPGCIIRDGGLSIGENATIGLGSVVTKNVLDNETIMGVPGQKKNDFLKKMSFLNSIK